MVDSMRNSATLFVVLVMLGSTLRAGDDLATAKGVLAKKGLSYSKGRYLLGGEKIALDKFNEVNSFVLEYQQVANRIAAMDDIETQIKQFEATKRETNERSGRGRSRLTRCRFRVAETTFRRSLLRQCCDCAKS
jgi:hypothetical protein